jgi:plasmid stabilization system protein ParE
MLAFSFHPEAAAEVDAALAWLTARDPTVAAKFLDELQQALRAVREAPLAHPLWPGVSSRHRVHRCVLAHFSFSLAFLVEREHLFIVAFAHQRRRPGYWLKRVRER